MRGRVQIAGEVIRRTMEAEMKLSSKRTIISSSEFAFLLLSVDAVLVSLIIACVPYTKIVWDAYMSQVEGFLGGERDYTKLKGDTGPLVYPAGFLYVYTAIRFLTGGEVFPAQILFGVLYVINLAVVLVIYMKTEVLPWWALCLLSLSKRIHSIFMLRLFNDCFTMTLLHASMALVLYQKWHLALIIFSGAVSIKMNVLLYAPPLFILMLKGMTVKGLISSLASAALVQILLGFPFLLSYPIGYISSSFNLSRVFIHFCWVASMLLQRFNIVLFLFEPGLLTLNLFLNQFLYPSNLQAYCYLFIFFSLYCLLTIKWCKHEGGLICCLQSRFYKKKTDPASRTNLEILSAEHIVTVMFVGNFIGIVCARSLHYQFYSWYFYSLPYLLWKTHFPITIRILLFCGVELCWNIYPSNFYSSFVLLFIHLCILGGLWIAPSEHPYVDRQHSSSKKE